MSTTASDVSNRRVEPRRRARGNVRIGCMKGKLGLGMNLAFALLDASETGVRLIVTTALEKGQEIEVNFVGPARGKPCKQLAEVMWCVPAADGRFCVGARFHHRLSYSDLQDVCR